MHHKKIQSLLKKHHVVVTEAQYDESLIQYGLDSLQLALFILAVEQKFNVKIPLESIVNENKITVNRINELLEMGLQA